MSDEFEGFESANTTPVPDVLFDQLLAKLSGTELKVLLYIIRRTHGFKKATDAISLSQFTDGIKTKEGKQLDKGCGIKNRTAVSHALANLEKMKCIKSTKGLDPSGDAAVTLYSIHFTQGVVQKAYHRSAKGVPPVVSEAYYRGNQNALPVVQKAYPQETVLQLDSLQQTDSQERAASSQSNEHARALEYENNNHSYRHDHTRSEDAWRCENWCHAHEKTCSDYQAWIENGGRETPTEPRVEAVKIGATDDSPVASHTPVSAPSDTSGGTGIPAPVLDRGSVRRDGVELEESQSLALRAAGATQPQVASASTPGRAAAPPAATVPHSLQGPVDGAATDGGSEPRASHGDVTQEKLRILDDWDKVQGQPVPRIRRHMEAALALVTAHPTREELAGCQKWLPETDNPKTLWYHKRGVGLWDVAEKLGLYRNHLALSIEPAPLADVKKTPTEAPVKRWNAAEHRKMLKEFEARERREQTAKQQNLQA